MRAPQSKEDVAKLYDDLRLFTAKERELTSDEYYSIIKACLAIRRLYPEIADVPDYDRHVRRGR